MKYTYFDLAAQISAGDSVHLVAGYRAVKLLATIEAIDIVAADQAFEKQVGFNPAKKSTVQVSLQP